MVSNKVLALLIVVTILFSVSAQFISIFRLSNISVPTSVVESTGFATSATGLVNFTILSSTDISIHNATIDFGVGVVNTTSGCSYANLSNNGTDGWNAGLCWVNQSFNGIAVRTETSKIVIQNDGNINVSVAMTSVARNATNFIGNCSGQDTNNYLYASFYNGTESAACEGAATGAWTALDGSAQNICSELGWQDSGDAVAVAFNISICSTNSPKGYKNDNLTFTSTSA